MSDQIEDLSNIDIDEFEQVTIIAKARKSYFIQSICMVNSKEDFFYIGPFPTLEELKETHDEWVREKPFRTVQESNDGKPPTIMVKYYLDDSPLEFGQYVDVHKYNKDNLENESFTGNGVVLEYIFLTEQKETSQATKATVLKLV